MPYVTSLERIAKQEGQQEGLREGLLSGIEIALALKFGNNLEDILSEISEIENIDTLKRIQNSIIKVNNLENLRKLYQC